MPSKSKWTSELSPVMFNCSWWHVCLCVHVWWLEEGLSKSRMLKKINNWFLFLLLSYFWGGSIVTCYSVRTVLYVEKKMKLIWRDFHLSLTISVKVVWIVYCELASSRIIFRITKNIWSETVEHVAEKGTLEVYAARCMAWDGSSSLSMAPEPFIHDRQKGLSVCFPCCPRFSSASDTHQLGTGILSLCLFPPLPAAGLFLYCSVSTKPPWLHTGSTSVLELHFNK